MENNGRIPIIEQEAENEKQHSLFQDWQKRTLTKERYMEELDNFPEQIVKPEQIIGWFDSGETKNNKFTESYFAWRDKNYGTDNGVSHHFGYER